MAEVLTIDSTKGGNGDLWMRLVSFYAMAELLPNLELRICVPSFLQNLAKFTFGDRLDIVAGPTDSADLTYTNLGIKDLLVPIVKGKRFISPYQRSVINDKKKKHLKDYINRIIFDLADVLGVVQVPEDQFITAYQGYLDVIGVKKLRHIEYHTYLHQLKNDYQGILDRQHHSLPISPELSLPLDLKDNVIFFPTGTSRQFVPVWWAVQNMPDAYYAFFSKDADAKPFLDAGLKVIYFYKEPGDIIHLSNNAKWTITTDSFPSHLLQYATARCTVALTEVLSSRIISPVFQGVVVDSLAPCHPCLHMARSLQPLCAAGFSECLNWKNPVYTSNIINSVENG